MKKLIITFLLCGWAINLYALPPFFSYGGGGTVSGEVNVSNDAYNATTWDNDAINAPSRNAVRDKFESLDGDYQPLDTDLTIFAGITPSANVQTVLGCSTYADIRTALGLVIGTNVQAYDADLADLASASPTGTYDLSGATITFGLEASDIPNISGTYATAGHNHTGTYEPADATIMKTGSYANLTAINAVSPSSGYLRYNGSAFVYDTPSGTEHDAVTLGSDADTILGLSTQQITLDTQTANYVFAGPATGEAADPTFRALVADDIPNLSGIYQAADTELAAIAALANGSGVLTNDGSGGLSWGAGGGSMVYPGAGVPVSTGSAWGTSITDNSANWNTAYGWGDHSAAGYQASDTSLTNIAANWTVDSSGNVSGMGTIEPTPTTHPQAVLYDSDAPGSTTAEKAMAYLWGEYEDGADDAENSSAGIAAKRDGSWFDWIWYDKTVDQVKVTRDLDVDGDVIAKSLTITKVSGVPSSILRYEADGTSTLGIGELGPADISETWYAQDSNTQPNNSIPLYGLPSGTSGPGSTKVSTKSWLALVTTPGTGTDAQIYSAEAVDELVAGIEIDTINLTTLATDGTYQGITRTFTVDSSETNTAFGQAYHIDTDGELVAADADSADTAPCIGLAVEAGTGSKKVLLWGEIREDDWNWTPGGRVYLSTDPATTCGLTQTAPSGTGDQVHVIGIATSADTILLKIIDIGEAQ